MSLDGCGWDESMNDAMVFSGCELARQGGHLLYFPNNVGAIVFGDSLGIYDLGVFAKVDDF
jgi:hypothetical protein